MYFFSKKYFSSHYFFSFLMLVASFSFWAYATNGIRNGLATSMFLMALIYYDRKKWLMFLLFYLSILLHKSMLLPSVIFLFSYFFKTVKLSVRTWLVSILLSISLGGFFESLFANIGLADDRLSYLTTSEGYSTGFRFDFLIYSALPVFFGYYFIVKRGFKDRLYIQLFNTYVFCNAFWILVIRASFSNRFAYLSWFIMGVIFIYPLLKQIFFKNQFLKIGILILTYFSFSYLMGVILK